MKSFIFIFALVAFTLAEDSDHSPDTKKQRSQKNSPINTLPSNGHQKPLTYESYQQQPQPSATQAPLYPLAPQNYQQEGGHQQINHQQSFSFLPHQPQLVPLQFIPQPVIAPKFQLIASKNVHGQTQLTLIPQSVFMNHLGYGNIGQASLQQPLLTNHVQQVPQSVPTSVPSQAPGNHNYVTPQTTAYAQPSSSLPSGQANYYSQQQSPLASYSHNPAATQTASNYVYSQPSAQVYNNVVPSQSNHLYASPGQLLNYYQTNPQAKYQLLYGNSGLQHGPASNYQSPNPVGVDYEKYNYVQQQQTAQPSHKSDGGFSLNTNEYVSPPDTHFRPMISSALRSSAYYYKN